MPSSIKVLFKRTSPHHVKLIGILGIAVLLIALPVIIFVLQQQQQLQQNAYLVGGDADSCKLLQITLSENPTCPRLTASSNGNNTCTIPNRSLKNNVSNYTFTVTLKSRDGKSHNVQYSTFNNFCPFGYGDLRGTAPGECHCNSNDQSATKSVTVTSGGAQTVTMTRSPISGTNCGTYQFDFIISRIDGKICTYGTAEAHPGGVGHCETGNDCAAITPTPIPSLTPTPSATPTATPTVTPTPSVCTTPGPVSNVQVSCPNCTGQ